MIMSHINRATFVMYRTTVIKSSVATRGPSFFHSFSRTTLSAVMPNPETPPTMPVESWAM